MCFYTRKSKLAKELRGQLSAAEETIQTLQTEAQKEKQERAALEKALLEATITSSAAEKIQTLQTLAQKEKQERASLEKALLEVTDVQKVLIQRIARLEVDLETKEALLEATSSAAEKKIQALQTEAQKEKEERAALERALLEANDTSRSIQEELNQRNARLQVELETNKQAGENALDVSEKQLQKLQENMLQLQQEMARFQKHMRQEEERGHMLQETLSQERKTSQSLQEEVCKLQGDRDEANNTSRDLQKKLYLQKQLNKQQSKDLENCKQNLKGAEENKKYLQEMMVERNEEIARIEAELAQTKANLEEQEQLTRKSLEQVSVMEEQAKEKEKIEKRELEKLENLVQRFEAITEKLVTEQKTLKEEAEKEAEMRKEETLRNQQLLATLKEKDEALSNLEQNISSLQEEVQTLRESCKKPEETEKILAEFRNELEKKNVMDMKLEEELMESMKEQNLNLQDLDLLIRDLKDTIKKHPDNGEENPKPPNPNP